MIKVQDWVASIPDEEKHIAYVGEGKCINKEFLLCGDGWERYKDWSFFLDMAFDLESITTRDSRQVVSTRINRSEIDEATGVTADETIFKETYTVYDEDVLGYDKTDIAPLTKHVEKDGIHLIWTVLRQQTVLPGKLWATLRAASGEYDEIKKSDILVFEVDAAVCAVPATVPAVSVMEQMCQQAAEAKDSAIAAKEFAESTATGANRAAADALNCQFICENYAELTKERWQETVTNAAAAQQAQEKAAAYARAADQSQNVAAEYNNAASEQAEMAQQAAQTAMAASATAADAATEAEQAAVAAEEAAQRSKALIVTTEVVQSVAPNGAPLGELKSTHAASEIYEHLQNGGTAVLDWVSGEYLSLSGCTEQYAVFCAVTKNGMDASATIVTIDNDKGWRQSVEELGDGELESRVTTVENTLFGAPAPEPDPVETVTITNLITNPQFKDGTTGWTFLNQTADNGSVTVDEEGLQWNFTALDKAFYNLRQKATKSRFTAGHRYFLYAKAKYEGATPTNDSSFAFAGTTQFVEVERTQPQASGWSHYASIIDLNAVPSSSLYVDSVLGINKTSDYVDGTNVRFNHIMCIDLTAAFDGKDMPDVATMERWVSEQYANGFEGTATLALTPANSGEDEDATDSGLVGQVAGLEDDVATLQDAVVDLVETMENLPATDVVQTGTVYPALHDYYIANIEEARADYYNALEQGALTFTMLADSHLTPTTTQTPKNVEAASVWAKLTGSDFIIHGGDIIQDQWDKADALSRIDKVMEMLEKHARCPVFAVKGNHDTNEQHKVDGVLVKESRFTDKEFYLHANARAEKHGMVVDPDHPYSGYYYVDFPKQKIRMVCLNSTENIEGVDITTSATGEFRYAMVQSPNQMAWIENVALRVEEGWAVMMFSHMPPFKTENTGNRSTDNPNLRALCEAFANGTGSFAQQGAREFICHFGGHVHVDSYNNIGGLNYVTVNCTVSSKYNADSNLYLDRTASEDKLSLNSFIIDRANRTVKCIKVGAKPDEGYAGAWVDSFTW